MNKRKFLLKLKRALWGCPPSEIKNRLAFYAEMIDDRVEEGLTEKEAVNDIGDPAKIAEEIRAELNERPKKEKRPLGAGTKILIALGSPVWLSLLIAAAAVVFSLAVSVFAVVFSVFACLLALLICLYAAVLALVVSALAGLIAGIACAFEGMLTQTLLCIGAFFVCTGVAILLEILCAPVGKGILRTIVNVWKFIVRVVFRRRAHA
ncbi:MAG: DUF1700 domain-containing protein [Clostridia bacterium]|nr:DUF1700 domain-containing protein [Clostridia bacterium]